MSIAKIHTVIDAQGRTHEVWYDRSIRLWVHAEVLTEAGDIGPGHYTAHRDIAFALRGDPS